jgi:transposase-like protein
MQEYKQIKVCPYCKGTKIVKNGFRQKKLEKVQVYYCKFCQKNFTPLITRQKTYPIAVILQALTYYNRLLTLEEVVEKINLKYGFKIAPNTVLNWYKDFAEYLPFRRMRDFVVKNYNRKKILIESKMFHGQIYDFKYHRAKTELILSEQFKHYKFKPLRDFLELVIAECPHQVFKESKLRASQYKNVFNLKQVKIVRRENMAVKNTNFVVQAIQNNKLRHQILQEFMLVNDSVTVATEVPILLDKDDLFHYQKVLNFQVPISLKDDEIITGHIDFIQIRNGVIHILDYKPSAKKDKPIEQLTIYALALARLTGLRLLHFKCAWFDEEDYFEFFPLHVVYKKKQKRIKK